MTSIFKFREKHVFDYYNNEFFEKVSFVDCTSILLSKNIDGLFRTEMSIILNSIFSEEEGRIQLFYKCFEMFTGFLPFLRRITFNWKLKKVRSGLQIMVSLSFIKLFFVWLFFKNYLTTYFYIYIGDWLFKTISMNNLSLTIPFINKFFSFAKHALKTDKITLSLAYNTTKSSFLHPKFLLLYVSLANLLDREINYKR